MTRRIPAVLAALAAAALSLAGLATAAPAAAEGLHRPAAAPSGVTWPLPNRPRLDQGDRPTCGFYAPMQALNMTPGRPITQALADRISDEAQAAPASATTSSEDALAAVLARHGYPATRERLPATVAAVHAGLRRGPLVLGLPFTAGMYDTAADGRWRPTGADLHLQHAVVAYGDAPGRVRLLNQWGTWWGVGGTMYLTDADLARELVRGTVDRWTR